MYLPVKKVIENGGLDVLFWSTSPYEYTHPWRGLVECSEESLGSLAGKCYKCTWSRPSKPLSLPHPTDSTDPPKISHKCEAPNATPRTRTVRGSKGLRRPQSNSHNSPSRSSLNWNTTRHPLLQNPGPCHVKLLTLSLETQFSWTQPRCVRITNITNQFSKLTKFWVKGVDIYPY